MAYVAEYKVPGSESGRPTVLDCTSHELRISTAILLESATELQATSMCMEFILLIIFWGGGVYLNP